MALYGRLPRPGFEQVDRPRNAILLRSDIYTSSNFKRFAFVPKPQFATPIIGLSAYVTHIFNSPDPHELTALYHHVVLQPLCGISSEFPLRSLRLDDLLIRFELFAGGRRSPSHRLRDLFDPDGGGRGIEILSQDIFWRRMPHYRSPHQVS